MNKYLGLIILPILLIFLISCSRNTVTSSQQLIVGILPDIDSIPLIIAQNQGFFNKEGISVKLESFKSAPDRDSALQTGKLDGAISDILASAFAVEGGFQVKITSKTDGSYKLLANKDCNINDLPGIKGKSIAISKNTIIEYTTDMMLNEGKLKPTDVKKEIIAQIPSRLEMLQHGKVDLATLPEPMATIALKNGAKLISSSDKLEINPGIILFTKKSTESKSKEIKAFYKAYNNAVEYLQKEPVSSYIDIVIKDGGFPDAVKGSIILPYYNKASLPSEKDFNNVINWLKEKDLIKSSHLFKDLVDSSFVR